MIKILLLPVLVIFVDRSPLLDDVEGLLDEDAYQYRTEPNHPRMPAGYTRLMIGLRYN